jgi:SAM-dependent methyltransferase
VRKVYAGVVSEVIIRNAVSPDNFHLVVFDGINLPLDDNSVDIAYSNQVLEHLHPEDAAAQLKEIHRVLKLGGQFICVTPNRIGGPWDVSEFFDRECTGFHLKEYTYGELNELFRSTGFRHVRAYVGGQGHYWRVWIFPIRILERILGYIPWRLQSGLARNVLFRGFLGTRAVGTK